MTSATNGAKVWGSGRSRFRGRWGAIGGGMILLLIPARSLGQSQTEVANLTAGDAAAGDIFGHSVSISGEESELVAFDFAGFRQFISSTKDDNLLTAKAPVPPEVADERWRAPGFFFDGLMWGEGEKIVAQYYNILSRHADRMWRRFDGDAEVFPRASAMIGRTSGFFWSGYGNGVIDVLPVDIRSQFHWNRLNLMREIYDFSTDPERAFRTYGVRNRAGVVDRAVEVRADATAVLIMTFQLADADQPHLKLWAFYSGRDVSQRPSEWVYAMKDPQKNRTFLTRIRTRFVAEPVLEFPSRPEDLLDIHVTVKDITTVHFRDYTNLGPWERGNVLYGDPDELERPDAAETHSSFWRWRFTVGIVVATVALTVFYRSHYHLRNNRRLS